MKNFFAITRYLLFAGVFATAVISCSKSTKTSEKDPAAGQEEQELQLENYNHLAWSANDVIYELNTRQFTQKGTFNAALKHLDRLHMIGVDIIWFMPIHPISEKNRKGELGSPYAVSDYTKVNPNYGTLEDFRSFVDQAHVLGMHVLIDWVPNHTGWDNEWIEQHPEWYTQDEDGNVIHPEGTDWTDVADLNYDNQEMRNQMTEEMKFWLKNADIDGFRCDVAHSVPVDFWDSTITELRKVKPVFMLAEAEKPELNEVGFDMSYGWSFHHLTNQIAAGEKPASAIDEYFNNKYQEFRRQDILMNFTSNHDENSWNGHVFERYGEGAKTFAVLVSTMPGMPLLYNGQEAALEKRLEFFKHDPIPWGNYRYEYFYKQLFTLKENNKALWNGRAGGEIQPLETGSPEDVYAFTRQKEDNQVIVILNLSGEAQNISITNESLKGTFADLFSAKRPEIDGTIERELDPWEFLVYHK